MKKGRLRSSQIIKLNIDIINLEIFQCIKFLYKTIKSLKTDFISAIIGENELIKIQEKV